MNNLSLRQQSIIDLIQRQEYCSIEELSAQFDVTTQTIRRDINELCHYGLAQRHHGGVGLPSTLSNRSFVSRRLANQDEKQRIAQQVVNAIPDGCTLFLGIGTTIAAIAEQLGQHKELRVVTNNFHAAHILSQYEQIETWLPGGRIRVNDGDVIGDGAEAFFAQFIADIAIVSCASISRVPKLTPVCEETQFEDYVMEHELREASVSQAILGSAQQKWLVANSSKWQRKASARVAPIRYFDRIFSDKTGETFSE
ncbi:DeoR/GlpR family DNA-binding transcription regulator [Vibrio hippocampi]|uniref:HTH-type transcriptional repressor CsqR n=1 Tax=Vibrio hippocampi TaxID=654686 RepID=A0ABN8DKV4_9VIBR|nr:DeoR/GlpR family DNA-binding transcription regulator [Vibrio hippocampi]CAH0528705.1 HTH-type transcriptional repressor CsqR [Vibrio hippocampi]